jgi:hypothetical protein
MCTTKNHQFWRCRPAWSPIPPKWVTADYCRVEKIFSPWKSICFRESRGGCVNPARVMNAFEKAGDISEVHSSCSLHCSLWKVVFWPKFTWLRRMCTFPLDPLKIFSNVALIKFNTSIFLNLFCHYTGLFIFLALQPIVVVFSQPDSEL